MKKGQFRVKRKDYKLPNCKKRVGRQISGSRLVKVVILSEEADWRRIFGEYVTECALVACTVLQTERPSITDRAVCNAVQTERVCADCLSKYSSSTS